MSLALQSHSSKSSFEQTNNFVSEHALRVCFTQNKASLAKQIPNQNSSHIYCLKVNSTYDPRVPMPQNPLAPAQQFHNLKSFNPNYITSDNDLASQVHFTQSKLTLAGHNPHLINQPYISFTSNTLFATRTNNHSFNSKLASHSTNTLNTLLKIEPQIPLIETHNTRKAPHSYQNQQQFTELSHFNLSTKSKPQLSSLNSTQKSHTLNSSLAPLVNSKKSVFAQTQSESQLSSLFSIDSIENSKTSPTMSQQVSSMKGKSASTRSSRTLPRVSFTENPTPNTLRHSSSHSNISTPLIDSPQALAFDKVVGKVFNKGLIASLTREDAVLKEIRDCIIRSLKNA